MSLFVDYSIDPISVGMCTLPEAQVLFELYVCHPSSRLMQVSTDPGPASGHIWPTSWASGIGGYKHSNTSDHAVPSSSPSSSTPQPDTPPAASFLVPRPSPACWTDICTAPCGPGCSLRTRRMCISARPVCCGPLWCLSRRTVRRTWDGPYSGMPVSRVLSEDT